MINLCVTAWVTMTEKAIHGMYCDPSPDVLNRDTQIQSSRKTNQMSSDVFAAFRVVFSTMLQVNSAFGIKDQLVVGPDSDLLCNYCDIDPAEIKKIERMTNSDRCDEFKVANVLKAITMSSACQKDLATHASARRFKGLKTKPKQYQKEGVQWMLKRELQGDALNRGHCHLHPGWIQLITADNNVVYINRINGLSLNFYSSPAIGTCGGLICDEMGLGKSLQILMLIIENPPQPNWAVTQIPPEQRVSNTDPVPIKTTLLVAPSTLLPQWEGEIKKHVLPTAMKWGRYDTSLAPFGPTSDGTATRPIRDRRPAVEGNMHISGRSTSSLRKDVPFQRVYCVGSDGAPVEMQDLDLCLCSYEDLRSLIGFNRSDRVSLLHQFGYWRVCIDEAQLIANSSSVAAQMCSSLWRRHAWVVTGTPVSHHLSEIQGLLEFLALEPIHNKTYWNLLIQKGCDTKRVAGLLAIRSVLRGVMIRRSKADVAQELELPPCSREDRCVALSTAEWSAYDRLKRLFYEAAGQYRVHLRAQQHQSNAGASARITAALVSLRQSTCHPQMVNSNHSLMGTQRLSMNDIIDRLLTQAYGEFDGALRSYFHSLVLKTAIDYVEGNKSITTCSTVQDAFKSILESIEDNKNIASLLLLWRNQAARLRDGLGRIKLSSTDIAPHYEFESLLDARKAINGLMAQDLEECFAEDSEIHLAKNAYDDQLRVIAEQWDIDHPSYNKIANRNNEVSKRTHGERKREQPDSQFERSAEAPSEEHGGGFPPKKRIKTSVVEKESQNPKRMEVELEQNMDGEINETRGDEKKGPSFKAMQHARRTLGPKPDLDQYSKTLRREASTRWRAWERIRLANYELMAHLLREELGEVARGVSINSTRTEKLRTTLNLPSAREELGQVESKIRKLRIDLGLINAREGVDDIGAGAASATVIDIRRSRRQAGIDAASDAEVILDPKEIADQLENSIVMVREYKELCKSKTPSIISQNRTVSARNEAQNARRRLSYVIKQQEQVMKEMGLVSEEVSCHLKAARGGRTVTMEGGRDHVALTNATNNGHHHNDDNAEKNTSCPVCFDEFSDRRLAITSCSHRFCSDCIHEALERAAPAPAPCPMCRTLLKASDIFEAMTDAEAAMAAHSRSATNSLTSEYGAKIATVLNILGDIRETDATGDKCVIFSSWGRILRLVGDALTANGIEYASLAGCSGPKRRAVIEKFLTVPTCRVLLVILNAAGGAAGLNLTVAQTAILIEPCINPGLEAQAAARIHRMGQTQPTRVIRLLAENTVDQVLVRRQNAKMTGGEDADSDLDKGVMLDIEKRLKQQDQGVKRLA